MAKQELLSKLKDVHLPADVSWWPLAIGWWVLIALFILTLISLIIYRYRKSQRSRLSRLAIKELTALQHSSQNDWLIQLEVLLKRVSLVHFPKESVASLTQDSWVEFLLKTGNNIWDDQSLLLLKHSAYQDSRKVPDTHKELIFEQAQKWLGQLVIEAKNV